MIVDVHNCYSLYDEQTEREWFYNMPSEVFVSAYVKSKEYKHLVIRKREHGKIVRKWVIDNYEY